MKNKFNIIFAKSACLTNLQMANYTEGKLTGNELRTVENHIADCKICKDMLEGYENLADKSALDKTITNLNNKIYSRIKRGQTIPMAVSQKRNKNFKLLSIAASIMLLISLGWIVKNSFFATDKSLATSQVAFSDAKTKFEDKNKNKETTIVTNLSESTEEILASVEPKINSTKNENPPKIVANSGNKIITDKVISGNDIEDNNNKSHNNTVLNKKFKDDILARKKAGIPPPHELTTDSTILSSEVAETSDIETEKIRSERIIAAISTSNSGVGIEMSEKKESNKKKFFSPKLFKKRNKSKKYSQENFINAGNVSDQELTESEEMEETPTFELAKREFITQNYEKSNQLFGQEYLINDNQEALFYKGLSIYKLNKFQEALAIFEEIISSKTKIADNALLMKAIILLKQGKVEEQNIILNQLAQKGIQPNDTLFF